MRTLNSDEVSPHLIQVAHCNRANDSHFVLREHDCLIERHHRTHRAQRVDEGET